MAKFKKGESGNPKGRPQGVRDRRLQARDLFAQHREELIAIAIKKAVEGDTQALRMCLDRICPTIKPIDAPVLLGVLPDTLAGRGEQVLRQLAEGGLPPDVATTILAAIAAQARIVETSELERRVAALERAHETP